MQSADQKFDPPNETPKFIFCQVLHEAVELQVRREPFKAMPGQMLDHVGQLGQFWAGSLE
jgi:hypothetical protein